MIGKFKVENWKKNEPSNLIQYFFTPCVNGLRLVNLFFQKILRINSKLNFMIHFTSQANGQIILGKNVVKSFASSGSCYFQGINGIYIGDNTIFAPGVKVISSNHSKSDLEKHVKTEPIRIGKNCWIGTNAVILPEVQLGDNVIIAAGAVVTKSFGDNKILAGVPAKPINNEE